MPPNTLNCDPLSKFADRYAHPSPVVLADLSIWTQWRFRSQGVLSTVLILRLIYFSRLYFTTFPGTLPKPQHLNTPGSEHKPPPIRGAGHGANGTRTEPTPEVDSQASYYYFTLDDDLFYRSFYQDWGPLNMAMVYRACILMHELLEVSVVAWLFFGSREPDM